jgi:hypothetical protein
MPGGRKGKGGKNASKKARNSSKQAKHAPAHKKKKQGKRQRQERGETFLQDRPSGKNVQHRNQIIEEDEYLGEIPGSVNFATTAYAVNPGNAVTFPYGSRIASLFQRYEYLSDLEFYIKREVSEYATQGQTGKVMLSFRYDPASTAPTEKQQVLDEDPHVDGMPCDPKITLHVGNPSIGSSGKLVRPGAVPSTGVIQNYDVGVLDVSTQGCANTSSIGELHVKYRCRVKRPVLSVGTPPGAVHFAGITPTTANNFATATLQTGGSPALTGITLGTNTIVWPAGAPGNYLVTMSVAGSTSVTAFGVASFGTGVTALNLFTVTGVRDAGSSIASLAGTTTSPAMVTFAVGIPAAGATTTMTASTLVGGNSMDLFIVSLPLTVLTMTDDEKDQAQVKARLTRLERLLEMIDEESDDEDLEECKTGGSLVDIEECHLGQSCSAPPPLIRQKTSTAEKGLAAAIRGLIVRRSSLSGKISLEQP